MNPIRQYLILFLAVCLVVPGAEAKTRRVHKHAKAHKQAAKAHRAPKPQKFSNASQATGQAMHVNDERDESHLHAVAQMIDRDTRGLPQDSHVETLATQFHVPLSVVEDMQKREKAGGHQRLFGDGKFPL